MDNDESHGWDAEMEFHPFYRLWSHLPMDYAEYHERRRAEDESERWGLPDVR